MTRSIWHSCNLSKLPASSKKYAKLVHDSTTQLHQSLEPVLSALNLRAIGLSKCANYDAALHDAQLMQQLSPSSALGYIREADIYSEQGKQRQVIDICSKGMSRVDTMDTHYATLQRAKMDAEERQNTRIDFVSQLPLDIVTVTLIPFFMDRLPLLSDVPYPYVEVSKLWRGRIVQCFGGLRFSVGYHEEYDVKFLSQVVQFSQDIKELFIHQYDHERTWLGDLLRDNDFCSLRQLSMGQYMNDNVDHFVSSLGAISSTLIDLDIDVEIGRILPIDQIVLTCPNLVSLNLPQSRVADLVSLPMTTWPNLKKLTINRAQEPVTCDQFIGIWKRFPSLNHLELHPCSDLQSALIVSNYLPAMNGLHIHLSDMGTGITFTDQGPSSETPAITKITIESLIQANGDTFADVGSVLKHHRKTIEDFCWAMDGENDNRDIYDIQYPQLKKLILNKSGWWIPRNAPLLEELTLSSRTINNHPAVLDTIPPSLRTLELKLNEVPELVDTSSIKQYLLRFAQHSHLHELVIISPTMDNIFNVVDAICHLKQLQRFAIIITMRPDSSQQDRFLDQLARGCTNLSCLEIYCLYKGLSTHSINTLKQLGNLKQCSFAIDPTSDDGIWHALETFPQLKCIRIYPAMPSHRMGIRRLKEKRPDMTVYLDQTFTRF